ncbi:MAG: histidinol dehydrogenase [Nitrospirae bacterium]|nr:histidinol dehydrogenase [Nitrospirota bacterium]
MGISIQLIDGDKEFGAFTETLGKRSGGVSSEIVGRVNEIVSRVKQTGDEALMKYTAAFDGFEANGSSSYSTSLSASFPAGGPAIPESVIDEYASKVDDIFLEALYESAKRIRYFHEKQVESSWSITYDGATLGQIIRPIGRVGVYVPGGKASYPSTVLMNVIPAQVAGVPEVAICVPTPRGEVNPYVMAAIKYLGVKEVYRVGGAQAVAAMAFGTKSIKRVDKIVGPGNIYVALAKKLVFGTVDIDMIAGPSEVLVVADDTANASLVAADLLSQAEHDEMASSVLVSTSRELIAIVESELKRQLDALKRREIAAKSLDNYGALIYAPNLEKAFDYSNEIAPEHLEIMVENPEGVLHLVKNAGAVFLGQWSPEPMGDYSAGPNHTLPTGGTSRFFSPLGVYDFLKRTSLINFTREGFANVAPHVVTLAELEGLQAHSNSVRLRMEILRGK